MKSLFVFKRPTSSNGLHNINNNSGWHFQTEIYSMCRFNMPNIREKRDMGSLAFSSSSDKQCAGIGFYVLFGNRICL